MLRTQVIHGDLTDDNALSGVGGLRGGDFGLVDLGVIDFGDVAESWTVAELAVTCASVLHHNPRDPLVVLETIAAFHERLPLTLHEMDALWPLVQLRAAVLIASGEHQVALEHDNVYADQNRDQERRGFAAAADAEPADHAHAHPVAARRPCGACRTREPWHPCCWMPHRPTRSICRQPRRPSTAVPGSRLTSRSD